MLVGQICWSEDFIVDAAAPVILGLLSNSNKVTVSQNWTWKESFLQLASAQGSIVNGCFCMSPQEMKCNT